MTTTPTIPPTIKQLLRQAVERLRTRTSTPRLDAEILLSAALGQPRTWLAIHPETPVSADILMRFEQWLTRRVAGTPVAYLTGSKEFWSLNLRVTPQVLVPRPETELLVELALQWLPADAEVHVLDLGTGSGAIALAIARERPRARILATDNSAAALEVARDNAGQLGIGNVTFARGEWYAALPTAEARFDLIVSNPPYVAGDDLALLQLQTEPRQALTAGPTGLEAIARIARGARERLRAGGWLAVEHGAGQAQAVRALLTDHRLADVRTEQDLAGRDRVTCARAL